MMSITELVQTKGWKMFMAKLYGWGAAVVIVGALFKIQHWPGAGIMLTVGLTTEALIFFFSAFEPLHEEVDWTLVYPELAGLEDEKIEESKTDSKKTALEKFDELINSAEITPALFEKLGNGLRNLSSTTEKLTDISDASVATNEYVSNIKNAASSVSILANTYEKSVESVKESADSLSNSYSQVAQKIVASGDELSQKIIGSGTEVAQNILLSGKQLAERIANSGGNLVEQFSKTGEEASAQILNSSSKLAEQINSSANNLAEKLNTSSNEVAEKLVKSSNELALTYEKLSTSINNNYTSVNENNQLYAKQLETLNKNLSALNAVYELQLHGANEHLKSSEALFSGLDAVMQNLKDSVEETKIYRNEVSKLGKNLSALNTVYGNMLAAMNISKVE